MSKPALKEPSLDDIDAALAERSLHEFVRVAWPVLHPATPFVDGWAVEAVTDHLEALDRGEIHRLLINIAPRMTKSVISSICFPAWVWIHNPSATFLYASYSGDLASEHSQLCRRLIESDWYRYYWGHVYRLDPTQNEKMHYDNDKGGTRAAYGMTSVSGHGGFFNIVDDAHDREDWKHPNEIKRNIDAYDTGIYNAVTDPVNCRRMVIGQRVAANDLSAHLKVQGGWEVLSIPTEYDPKRSKVTVIGWQDPRTREYELACPERWDRKEVDIVKKNRRLFSAYHQQDPTEDEGAIFKRADWCYYSDDPRDIVSQMDVVVQSWDLTSGGPNPGTSKVAGQVWGRLGGRKFLLDRVLDYMDAGKTLDAIISMSERWPQARHKFIESKAAGNAIMALLKKTTSGILPWPPEGVKQDNKVTYALAVQPQQQAHDLYLPDPNKFPWVPEMVEYFVAFPNGEFDDDIDSCTHAIIELDRIPSANQIPLGIGTATRWLR